MDFVGLVMDVNILIDIKKLYNNIFIKGLVIVIKNVFIGVLDFLFKLVKFLKRNRVIDFIFIFWYRVIKLCFNLWVKIEENNNNVVINFSI